MQKQKDIYNKDILLNKKNEQVMMEWEKPYMEECINVLQPHGNVLEIGYGLGYSASQIRKFNIKSHTIIEADDKVYKNLVNWADDKTIPVKGYWQKELKNLGKFDCIFFDDAPTDTYKDKTDIRLYKFIYELLNNHVNKNAKLTWFCGEPIHFLCHPNLSWDLEEYKIGIPKDCKYVTGDALYVPLIKFKKGIVNAYNQKALNNKFELERIN